MSTSSRSPNRIKKKKQWHVDAAAIQRRLFILPGEILIHVAIHERKSAEVIVVVGNEPLERTEVSQNSEGLNIKLFQMLHGVYSHALSGTEKTKEVKMIEQVINRRNMHMAYQQVLRNKGSAGVDGMQVSELKHYIKQYREAVATSIVSGKYLPQSIFSPLRVFRKNSTPNAEVGVFHQPHCYKAL